MAGNNRRSRRKVSKRLSIVPEGDVAVDRLTAIVVLGLCEALSQSKLSITQACDLFFVPVFLRLRKQGLDESLLSALHEASELENIERIVPQEVEHVIERIRSAAIETLDRTSKQPPQVNEKWLREEDA
jgi:hypothetical protein